MTQPPPRAPDAATGAGDHPEELENALLDVLRDGVPAGSAARMAALMRPYTDTITRAELAAEKGLSRSRTSGIDTYRGSFYEFLRRRFLPELARAILAAAPIPYYAAAEAPAAAPELNVIEAAELLLAITRQIGHQEVETDVVLGIADEIIGAVRRFGAALADALDDTGAPDMRRLTREIGKLELLRWLLVTLRVDAHHRTLSTQLQVAARRALRRASETIEHFMERRHAAARHATAAVTGEIEDLVTLVLLMLDTEREDAVAEAHNAFFNELSRDEVARFAKAATALAELMFDELDAMAGGDPQDQAIARSLRQVMILASFALRLDNYVTVDEVTHLGEVIARRRALHEKRHGKPV